MAVNDLAVAAHAWPGGRGEAATVLAGREQLIDVLYAEIEELAVREILLRAPVAADLRLLTVLRIVPELNRSHGLIARIAARPPPAMPFTSAFAPAPARVPARAAGLGSECDGELHFSAGRRAGAR